VAPKRVLLTARSNGLPLIGLIAGAALITWIAQRPDRVAEPVAPSRLVAQTVRPATTAAPHVDPVLITAVMAEVDRMNVEARKDREAFVAAGWTMTETAPPDPRLVEFDPSLLDGHEAELRAQLQSAAAPPDHAPQVLAIAESAREIATRVAAVGSLARMGADGQAGLSHLIAGGKLPPGDPARELAVASIQPPLFDADRKADLQALVASPALTEQEKKQLSAALSRAEQPSAL